MTGTCKECRFWNGATRTAAPCFAISGQDGEWFALTTDSASFQASDAQPGQGPYLMTGPDFGCTKFVSGKPRFYGDDNTA